jgi:hypothetical protein
MASSREREVNNVSDERAPLLAHDDVHYDTGTPPEEDDPTPSPPQKVRSRTWQYAWRGFWIAFGLLIVAVFVKGWIDADDVNVSGCIPKHTAARELIIFNACSLI